MKTRQGLAGCQAAVISSSAFCGDLLAHWPAKVVLSVGETHTPRLRDGSTRTLKLVAMRDEYVTFKWRGPLGGAHLSREKSLWGSAMFWGWTTVLKGSKVSDPSRTDSRFAWFASSIMARKIRDCDGGGSRSMKLFGGTAIEPFACDEILFRL